MNSLPIQPSTDQPIPTPVSGSSVGKEFEPTTAIIESAQDVKQAQDAELPKEVSAIGVRLQPTTIVLPRVVQNAGVQAVNPSASAIVIAPIVKLPLSDDEIAKGLHEGVISSVRWLAEWCVRRLKQVHIIVKDVGGKLVKI